VLEVHVLASGSDGNCTVIKHDDQAIMIDSGLSCRKTMGLMEQEGFDCSCLGALLITHEHSDHVAGAGPMARKRDIPIVCNKNTFSAHNFGAVSYKEIRTCESFTICGMDVTPLPTSHNAVEPNAFLVEAGGRKVLLATDTGKLTFPIEHALKEADLAIIEANYDRKMLVDGPYPEYLKRIIGSDIGHLSNIDCATAIKNTMNQNRKLFLAHLSKTNNVPDLARETVANLTGLKRITLDCLEFPGDTRTITVKG